MNRDVMEHVSYVDLWNVEEQRPEGSYTVAEARARHDLGERYSVLIGDGKLTEKILTLELAIDKITTRFLDRSQRLGMARVYAQREGDRLFLEWVAYYNYAPGDLRGVRPVHWETTDYGKDGSWHTIVHSADGIEESNGFVLDVAEQWEPIPAFGDYASIGRYV